MQGRRKMCGDNKRNCLHLLLSDILTLFQSGGTSSADCILHWIQARVVNTYHWCIFGQTLGHIGRWELKRCNVFYASLQHNRYETAPNHIQLSQSLILDFLLISVFSPVFFHFLHDLIIELFCRLKQNSPMIRSCKNCKKTNNPMSSFDLMKQNMELSHFH